jgi:hypothetical protein
MSRCEPITPENWSELQETLQRVFAAMTPEELAAGKAWAEGEIARWRRAGGPPGKRDA